MHQPVGFNNPQFPHHVYRLRKALYGLKQSSRAWNKHLRSWLVDLGFNQLHSEASCYIKLVNRSIIIIGWHVDDPNVDVVRVADEEGIARAVEHLVDLGHRDIAHVDGGDTLLAAARRRGYEQAMRRHDLRKRIRVISGGQSQLDGQGAARRLLAEGDLPSALVCYNDDVAFAAVVVLTQAGVDIPGQMSIIGFDNSDAAVLSPVSLTSVAQDPAQLASLAVERILARIDGRRVVSREVILEPELRVRESTQSRLGHNVLTKQEEVS